MASTQRSKSLAVMFLLGAFLTGGALGFVADRAVTKRPYAKQYTRGSMREEFARTLSLDESQRRVIDSIFRWRDVRSQAVMQPIQPALDSARDSARVLITQQLDSAQRRRFKAMIDSITARDSVRKARGDSK